MIWNPERLIEDFLVVARLAHVDVNRRSVRIEVQRMPHASPSHLPPGKMAVYVFSDLQRTLKVGKVGTKSGARYVSQHYSPTSAKSTLAASLLKDREAIVEHHLTHATVGDWIKENTDRANLLVDTSCGMPALTLLEAFVQCRLRPVYEGYSTQR